MPCHPSHIALLLVALGAIACHSEEAAKPPDTAKNPAASQPAGTAKAESGKEPPPAPKDPSDLFDLPLEKVLNIEVKLLSIEVTTVSRQESTVGHSPAAIFVITPEMIERSGCTTIPELFRMVPGMDVARSDGNKWNIGVRGFNDPFANKLLVQVDGRTVYNPLFAGVYWDAVDYPLEDIERIEVIRGPGASVWGANAVNGVINIITKSSKDTQGGRVSGGGGTQEQGFGEFSYSGRTSDTTTYRVYGKGFDRTESFIPGGGKPNDGWTGESGGMRVDMQPTKEDSVLVEAGYLHDITGDVKTIEAKAGKPFFYSNLQDEETNSGDVVTRWSHQTDKDSGLSLELYWDHFDRNSNNLYHLRWDTFDLDYQQNFKLGEQQKIVYGASYRIIDAFLGQSTNDNGFVLSFPQRHRAPQVGSTFVQDEIDLIDEKLSLTLGSKFEYNDHTGFEAQPTARLLWVPTKTQSFWASASRAVRTPSLFEDEINRLNPIATAVGQPFFLDFTGNPQLDSESVIAYELGYRTQATEKFSLDLALFANSYDKLKADELKKFVQGPPGIFTAPVIPENALSAETLGGELALEYQPFKWWQLRGSYSYLKVETHPLHDTKAQHSLLESQQITTERQSPEHQLDMRSAWTLPRRVELDLISRFVDTVQYGTPAKVPRYVSLDARTAWRPKKNLELELVGQNLLQSHHQESGSEGLGAVPVESRRGVYGKITFRF